MMAYITWASPVIAIFENVEAIADSDSSMHVSNLDIVCVLA